LLPVPSPVDMEKLLEALCLSYDFDDHILDVFDAKDETLNSKEDTVHMFKDNHPDVLGGLHRKWS
jgi:hypothetical protein